MNFPGAESQLEPVQVIARKSPVALLVFFGAWAIAHVSWYLVGQFIVIPWATTVLVYSGFEDPYVLDDFFPSILLNVIGRWVLFPSSVLLCICSLVALGRSIKSQAWPIWSTICVCFSVFYSGALTYYWIWSIWLLQLPVA